MTFKKALFATFSLTALAAGLVATPTADGLYAVFDTSKGTFTAELFYEKAPLSCANMVGLAEGTIPHYATGSTTPIFSKFYDGLTFHRVVATFVIQGGDPLGNGTGGPGYEWPDEVHPDLRHSGEGYLSMANSGANTNGSQFFVTLDATPSLDGIHNVFGKVVEGIEVVRSIGITPVNSADTPTTPILLNSVDILRIGEAANAFDPTFYATHFDPSIDLFGEDVQSDIQISNPQSGSLTVSVPFEPLTEYRVSTSDDLENWSEIAHLLPSLDPDSADPAAQLSPETGVSPKFARIDTKRRQLSDMSEVVEKVTIVSGTGANQVTETIEINPNLVGTYQFNDSTPSGVYIDWLEISKTRTQLRVMFPNYNSSIQFYLDRSAGDQGSVYIRDQNFTGNDTRDDIVVEGTFTITRVQ